ncbi:hypothetical protein M422DRAFT_243667 [Sphaerobolus stellatus SS14]|nr:hypothetical protein M422DRAFT_243667 [Sphaerobolus stellatus SS14]
MRIRQYSISSSPLWNGTCVSITLSIVQLPNEAGLSNKFLGVASNYLAKVCTGDRVQVGIRSSAATFHLPEDSSVPVGMFAAGSGIAPMRGFIQQRDFLYVEDDLKEWEELGFLEVKLAFRRKIEDSFGCRYVQDRALYDKELIYEYFFAGAKFYTCGSPPVANALKESLISLVKFCHADWDDERLARKWGSIQKVRLITF